MRTREEIEESGVRSGGTFIGDSYEKLSLEVLLDIRDLLTQDTIKDERNHSTAPYITRDLLALPEVK